MICQVCGIDWEGKTPSRKCARCQPLHDNSVFCRHPLADAPPMPAGEIQALLVQLKQIGWTPSES